MQKHKAALLTLCVYMSLSVVFCFPEGVEAATCDHLKVNISKERSSIKRRALFRQAIEVCEDDAELRFDFAYELERYRKYEEALKRYQEALKLNPTLVKAYFNMGDIYKSQEKYAEAVKAYENGLKIDKDNTRALKNLEESRRALK